MANIEVGIDATVSHLEQFLNAVITTEEEALACRNDMVRRVASRVTHRVASRRSHSRTPG